MLSSLLYTGRDFSRQMNRKNISAFAASTAFFIFISLIPMLILLCSIVPYTTITEANLMRMITEITPDITDSLVVSIIEDVYDKSAGVISLAAIATIWSAGKGMLALMRGLNEINDVEEDRNYMIIRGIASFYTLLMLIVVLLSVVVMGFGSSIVNAIIRALPRSEGLFHFLMNFRLLFSLAIMIVGFAIIYAYIPNKKLKVSYQIPGAVFSSILWNVFSWGFSIYVNNVNDFSTYGNLATIVIIMLWLYIGIYIIMIGAYINRYFAPMYKLFFEYRKAKKIKRESERKKEET